MCGCNKNNINYKKDKIEEFHGARLILDKWFFDKLDELIEIAKNKIDRIILNAGISLGHASGITPYNDFQYLFQTNFLSLHAFLEPILPTLIDLPLVSPCG